MLIADMVLRDFKKILSKTDTKIKAKGAEFNAHLSRYSKDIFNDGAVVTQISALALESDCESLRVKDEVFIETKSYQIVKIERESQYLKRLYLKEI